jgi:hypothetical protein
LLPRTCSISKSNSDKRRLQRIRRLLLSEKLRKNFRAAWSVLTKNFFPNKEHI